MKSQREYQKNPVKPQSSESEGDCTCQLLDTSLSDVGDSDCSCSQCLQANLQAFNELKELEENMEKENDNRYSFGSTTRHKIIKQTRRGSKYKDESDQKTKIRIKDFKSLDKMKQTRPKTSVNQYIHSQSQIYKSSEEPSVPTFSRECINDYIKITQHRAREYMNQRNRLQKNEIEERQRLKQMIKENLQGLNFTIQSKLQPEIEDSNIEKPFEPDHKWGHQPYHCKSRIQCIKLNSYDPDLQNKQQEIAMIKERIKNYQQKTQEQSYECPDKCPNHHMRTSKKKLAEITKFIQKKAKAYQEQRQKEKTEQQQKKKIKAAKLRAIDIRCRDIAVKSKKYDGNVSRTSFHNSIDHFSTFSELKQNKMETMMEKERRQKIKKAMKEKGGTLEEKIYQNLSDSLIGDHPAIHSKMPTDNRYEERQNEESDRWCDKIMKEAKIRPPKQIKKEDKQKKSVKKIDQSKNIKQTQKQEKEKKSKKEHQKILRKQEEKRKQLLKQIQKKKQQIFKQYQKRNTAANIMQDPKNKKLRMKYEQLLKGQKSPPGRQHGSKKQQQYDPYSQVYKHQLSKNSKQLNIVGNPLLQQYEYQKGVGRRKELGIDEDQQIFTKSGKNLRNKQFLYV